MFTTTATLQHHPFFISILVMFSYQLGFWFSNTRKHTTMSLSLIQSYSSDEEDQQQHHQSTHDYQDFSDDNEDDDTHTDKNDAASRFPSSYNPVTAPQSSTSSALPSAFLAFSEISGPPQFLNNCVEDQHQSFVSEVVVAHRSRRRSRDKKDLPSGAVVEAKPHLIGIHERVRSDIEGKASSTQPQKTPSTTTDGGSQPSMCLLCGIPKVYSSALGTVCPVCSDDSKKKGSTVKDKEKVKRMKGQSSHASWKSETEMHLRQHYD